MNRWSQVGVAGGANWPTKETVIKFGDHELVLKLATKKTEQSVHINLSGIPDIDALTLINRFLSILSWCADQAMENLYGWSGNPVPKAVPRRLRILGASPFAFYRDLIQNERATLALALYREGRTVNSIPFSFLSYFKILNVFWKDKKRDRKNPIVEGIRGHLPLTKDERAQKPIRDLTAAEPDVAQYLYESGRCAIAHAYSTPVVDPDDVSDVRRLSRDRDIIKAIAEYLIEHELSVSLSLLG